jgi:hypothetical protein
MYTEKLNLKAHQPTLVESSTKHTVVTLQIQLQPEQAHQSTLVGQLTQNTVGTLQSQPEQAHQPHLWDNQRKIQ